MTKTNQPGAAFPALQLPDAPPSETGPVKAWSEPVTLLSYLPDPPDANPMFLEKRVYQGSSGRVYPLPVYDRIAMEPVGRQWQALHIENDYLRVMILPEIGGRIHIGYDKVSGYDFFYRQNVIKPALVGLAGPWASGGVEFNWPQHHRPATFMPVNTEIERSEDGSATLWCSDHDPMLRMKGMHGVCLHPDRAVLELRVRLYNRTQWMQNFLWWSNVATRVHEQYQSFFPPDVRYVADHAKRAITTFPLSNRPYYGVDYPGRAEHGVPEEEQPAHFRNEGVAAPNDLSWYANIPVPTSYMVAGSQGDFHGGYDHARDTGVVHVANHHISPGKKQWTWGNHEFGYSWDRCLTDDDGPYIELMAGVYTDNQPDFSYLAPWETKSFRQTWYPIHAIGIPQAANTEAALHLSSHDKSVRIGMQVTRDHEACEVELRAGGDVVQTWQTVLRIREPFVANHLLSAEEAAKPVSVRVRAASGVLIEFDPASVKPAEAPAVAEEPAAPEEVRSVDELFLTGQHLAQYSHATRDPDLYWNEALRRDGDECRVRNALGLQCLRRGEIDLAIDHFRASIRRMTRLNPNPRDGEPFYNLGLALRFAGDEQTAYDAFYKATWNAAWRSPAYFALAELDAKRGEWRRTEEHLRRTLAAEADHLNARNLLVRALRELGDSAAAEAELEQTRALDPLDIDSRWLAGLRDVGSQEALDLAFDLLRSGRSREALEALQTVPETDSAVLPIALLLRAEVEAGLGNGAEAERLYEAAERGSLRYCFPHRLEELLLLQRTIERHPRSAAAAYLLGTLLYDKRRYPEAIAMWERSAEVRPDFATVWRNLGIAYFNVRGDVQRSREAYDRALALAPGDARIVYERDQLWKRVGVAPEARLHEMLAHADAVARRDDLSVELATLYNQTGKPDDALAVLQGRQFQPWEGGEGLVLGQYVRARLQLGQKALAQDKPNLAIEHFERAKQPPPNLSESKHLLANQSEIDFWLGEAWARAGKREEATRAWEAAARQRGDFRGMAVRDISDMTFWSASALARLCRKDEARALFQAILGYAAVLETTEPKIDYFATSLPTMLLFNDDLRLRNKVEATLLRAQAKLGLREADEAAGLLDEVLRLDRNQAVAADLLHFMSAERETTSC